MRGCYYIKKHRREKRTKEQTPQFVIRRVYPGTGLITWQGRYYNLYKTYHTVDACIDFVEGLLNGNIDLITRDMVISEVIIEPKQKEIMVVMKGILDDDFSYFTEKYEGEHPGVNQVENFTQSCFIRWKFLFQRLNKDYVKKLYANKQIGFKDANRQQSHQPA